MVKLNRITKGIKGEVFAKLEYFSPSGSVKDRIALSMIESAEKEGILDKDSIIVEPTSGNTGIALAMVCAVKGYKMIAVMPEAMSEERKKMIEAFGAEVILTPCKNGKSGEFTKEDVELALKKAEEMAKNDPKVFVPNQFSNPNNPFIHQETTGKEIIEQTEGKIDIFVAAAGTGGTITGVAKSLKKYNPNIKTVVVEPFASAVISGDVPGYHKIQGIGEGFIPDVLDVEICDEIIKVKDEEAIEMAKRLTQEEGIFAGISGGANVAASLKIANSMKEAKIIVTIIPDSGARYFTTQLFSLDSFI
jgi:cysteine synthase A